MISLVLVALVATVALGGDADSQKHETVIGIDLGTTYSW